MNCCPCWFYTLRKVNSICLLQQLYSVRGAEKELLGCWLLHSQRGQQGTSFLIGHLQSGQSSSLKSIVHGGSCTDRTLLFAIKEDCLLEFSPFSGFSKVNFLCSQRSDLCIYSTPHHPCLCSSILLFESLYQRKFLKEQ